MLFPVEVGAAAAVAAVKFVGGRLCLVELGSDECRTVQCVLQLLHVCLVEL
jgi:hypothetical protein